MTRGTILIQIEKVPSQIEPLQSANANIRS